MPMFRSCMSPATTPLKPTSASTPLTIISTRINAASRLPPKTGAAKNIESAKKKSGEDVERVRDRGPFEREEQWQPRLAGERGLATQRQDDRVQAAGHPREQAHEDDRS